MAHRIDLRPFFETMERLAGGRVKPADVAGYPALTLEKRMEALDTTLKGLTFEQQYTVLRALCAVNMEIVKHPMVQRWTAENAARVADATKPQRPFMCCEHDEECERQGVPCSNHVSNDPPKQDVIRVVATIRPQTGEFAIRRAYEGEQGYAEIVLQEFNEYEAHKEDDATWFDFCVDLVAEQHNRGTKR